MLSSKWVYISKNNPTFTPPPPPHLSLIRSWAVQYCFLQQEILSCLQVTCRQIATQMVARYSFSWSIPPKIEHKLRRHKQRFGKIVTNNNEVYLHDHTSTYSIAKAMFIGIKITTQGNYVTLMIICHEHQNKLKYIL